MHYHAPKKALNHQGFRVLSTHIRLHANACNYRHSGGVTLHRQLVSVMSRTLNKLSALTLRKAKPDPGKRVKLRDGGGLVLVIYSNGSMHWMLG